MPVNIPHNMPVDQKLYEGTSGQQLGGVVDLLMNFDRFTKEQFSIKPLIKAPPPAPTPTPGAAGTNSASAPPQNNAQ
jgi:hypothetical protein